VDAAANTEERPVNAAAPTSNDEDFMKFLRLSMCILPLATKGRGKMWTKCQILGRKRLKLRRSTHMR
jgi:hypothetical protein